MTVEQIKKAIVEATEAGKKKHVRTLNGLLKTTKRNGAASIKVVGTLAGTLLAAAEVTSIYNHGSDHVDLEKIDEYEDGEFATAWYFGKEFMRTGWFGSGPETRSGSWLYKLKVPCSLIAKEGAPTPESLRFKIALKDAFTDTLKAKGITEEWYELSENIQVADDLFDPENDVSKYFGP